MRCKTQTGLRLLLCGLMVFAPGCQVTDPNGGVWKLGPSQPGTPSQGKQVGTFKGPDGKTYILIDFNDDGVPDVAYDPETGQMRPIQQIGVHPLPVPKKNRPNVSPPPDGKKPKVSKSGGNGNSQSAQEDEDWGTRIDWGMSIEPPRPIEFEGTAAENIAALGLNVEPGTEIETEALQLHLFDTVSRYTDITFNWQSEFRWDAGNKSYIPGNGISYEFYALPGETVEDAWYLSLRVAGPLKSVAKWAVNMDLDRHWTFEFDWEGSTWTVDADAPSNTLTLYQNGQEVGHEPLY